ncbi:MAG: hypothetical protein AABX11_04460, partial [Nanoarchaeota archaeon]
EVIQYGYNKKDENVRYVFVENSGWIRYIEGGTAENPTEIPADYVDTGALNRLTALKYYEHPTLIESGTKSQFRFELLNNSTADLAGHISLTSEQLDAFDFHGVYKFVGKYVYVLPITFKNSDTNQLTNVFGGLTQSQYDHLTKDIKATKETESVKIGESILSQVIHRTYKTLPWLRIPRAKIATDTKYADVVNLYPPGTILGLFSDSPEFDSITSAISRRERDEQLANAEYRISLANGIPFGFSNKVVPLFFNNID